jgi:glycine betaine catabolism A
MSTTLPIDRSLLEVCIAPLDRARTLPAEAYTSAETFDWERDRFFEGSWVCIGRADQLPDPGDQRAVAIGAEGVLLVRGKDGTLRGFSNTCRHRGHELLPCGADPVNRSFVRCPYHSWTYGLDGDYKTAPDFADRPGWSPTDPDNALLHTPVAEWGGWVFVNADGKAPLLHRHVGNLEEAIRPYQPERLVPVARHDYVVNANWKLVHENYHECYHCTNIHPELCRVTPPDSGVQFEPTGLVVGGSMDLMDHAETMSLDGKSDGEIIPTLDAEQRRRVEYWGVFPNLLISAHPDYVLTHRLEPLAHDRTRIECEWLFPPEVAAREEFDPSYAVEFWDITNRQDWKACEAVQRGVSSRAYLPGPLAYEEDNVHQFLTMVAGGYLEGRPVSPSPPARVAPLR